MRGGPRPERRAHDGRKRRILSCARQRFGGESLLYIRCLRRKPDLLVMDTILSLLNGDLSIWGVIAMPIGVAICFGPALAVWLKEEMRGGDGEKKEDHRKPSQKQ